MNNTHIERDILNETTYHIASPPQLIVAYRRFDAIADEDNFYFFVVHHENRVGGSVKHKINLIWPNDQTSVFVYMCMHGVKIITIYQKNL